MAETFEFKAEISQLMSLIINAFYSNKDIFLRELISNASDAIEKIKFNSITNPELLNEEPNFNIEIKPLKESKKLLIKDTGIGMTKDDLINNLGMIAKSGTKEFRQMLESKNAGKDFIGQFGVGFYSAFLVADTVQVISKNHNDEQYIWKSDAKGAYTIELDQTFEYGKLSRGTLIVLDMKEDQLEYLETEKIKQIIKRHSEFVNCNINLLVEEKKDETIEEKKEQLNKQPIWTRNPSDITDQDYIQFYKEFSKDHQDPLAWKHFSVEGNVEFKGIIFIPSHAPFDMFETKKIHENFKLYVRKVLITDNNYDNLLVPEYLKFMCGIVDSEDLPLNVSREMIQQNKTIKLIKKQIVKKCIELFTELINNTENDKYNKFYDNYAKNIKLGVHEDSENREKLVDLLKFKSNKSDTMVSLKEYVERMNSDSEIPEENRQKDIYFLTGESNSLKTSPFLERFNQRNIEVLLMDETIDEYCVNQLKDYNGKTLICVTKAGLTIPGVPEVSCSEEFKKCCTFVKQQLNGQINEVKLTNILVEFPCVVSTQGFGWTANMARIMKNQPLSNDMAKFMKPQKVLLLNPENELIKELNTKCQSDNETDKLSATLLINMLYNIGLISSGFDMEDPNKYARETLVLTSQLVHEKNIMLKHSEQIGLQVNNEPVEEPQEMPELENMEQNENEDIEEINLDQVGDSQIESQTETETETETEKFNDNDDNNQEHVHSHEHGAECSH